MYYVEQWIIAQFEEFFTSEDLLRPQEPTSNQTINKDALVHLFFFLILFRSDTDHKNRWTRKQNYSLVGSRVAKW